MTGHRGGAEEAAADIAGLAAAVRAGDRVALARAITLVESRRAADAARGEALLEELAPHAGGALRVGITGSPGVGKSTFIEASGRHLIARGHKVAVLAVDPSSTVTGGSILGDKTRMAELSRNPDAFIRPSPGGGTAGGVARNTREAILLCETAGYDFVLVETIGSGQSDVAVAGMVDFFLVLLLPGAGDELQGIKRGVMELCDGVVVHKADLDPPAADTAQRECAIALRMLRGDPAPPVMTASAKSGSGLPEAWRAIEDRVAAARRSGALDERRKAQAEAWLDAAIREEALRRFHADPRVRQLLPELRKAVRDGTMPPLVAIRRLRGAKELL